MDSRSKDCGNDTISVRALCIHERMAFADLKAVLRFCLLNNEELSSPEIPGQA